MRRVPDAVLRRFPRWRGRPSRLLRRFRPRYMAACLLLVYAQFFGAGGCADHFLLHPSDYTLDVVGATRTEIPRHGGTIEAFVAHTVAGSADLNGPDAFVLEFTGNGTRAEYIAAHVPARWEGRSVQTWTINYPGYGRSTGPAKLASLGDAAIAAFDHVAALANGKPLFVCGNSLGTVAALHVAAHRPVAGLILKNPPPLRQVIVGRHGWWNLWLLATPVALGVPDSLDSISNARASMAPAVFITSRYDDYVPPRYQELVIQAYAGPKRALTIDGGHNDSPDELAHHEMADAVSWLWKLPSERSTAERAKR